MIEFIKIVGELKGVPRTGWIDVGVEEPESVADHCFRTTVISMVLADLRGLDAEKVVRMSLLHDLAESVTGDLTPGQKAIRGAALVREEEDAVRKALSNLPGILSERYGSLWAEYREGLSPEAMVVVESDRADMLIQALEYEERGADASKLRRFWDTKIEDPILSELLGPEMEKRRGRN